MSVLSFELVFDCKKQKLVSFFKTLLKHLTSSYSRLAMGDGNTIFISEIVKFAAITPEGESKENTDKLL